MATKTISITEEAYERLKAQRKTDESFSNIILKLTKMGNLKDFAGILGEKEAAELKTKIEVTRKLSRLRAENIRKRLSE